MVISHLFSILDVRKQKTVSQESKFLFNLFYYLYYGYYKKIERTYPKIWKELFFS